MSVISAKKKSWIRSLLKKGLSNKEIAKKAGVVQGTVDAIEKLSNTKAAQWKYKYKDAMASVVSLEKQIEILLQKRECKHLPQELLTRREISKVLAAEIPELIYIANDIQELNELHLIKHPLFCNLARRAKKVLTKIGVQNATKET